MTQVPEKTEIIKNVEMEVGRVKGTRRGTAHPPKGCHTCSALKEEHG